MCKEEIAAGDLLSSLVILTVYFVNEEGGYAAPSCLPKFQILTPKACYAGGNCLLRRAAYPPSGCVASLRKEGFLAAGMENDLLPRDLLVSQPKTSLFEAKKRQAVSNLPHLFVLN
jgi:hypothetical protein